MMIQGKLCRPPLHASALDRLTEQCQWVQDDGQPGIAFVGLMRNAPPPLHMNVNEPVYTPTVWSTLDARWSRKFAQAVCDRRFGPGIKVKYVKLDGLAVQDNRSDTLDAIERINVLTEQFEHVARISELLGQFSDDLASVTAADIRSVDLDTQAYARDRTVRFAQLAQQPYEFAFSMALLSSAVLFFIFMALWVFVGF